MIEHNNSYESSTQSCSGTSAQTFCNLNGQTVKDNPDIKFTYTGCITNTEFITPESLNEIIVELKNIYYYGLQGDRNPSDAINLNKVIKNNFITLKDYNDILKTINANQLSNYSQIKGSYFKDLETIINSYVLNSNRCDTCNVGCNVGCEVVSQCCTTCYDCGGCQYYSQCSCLVGGDGECMEACGQSL